MQKYLLLKLGMNVSEVEKVLQQKIILERHRSESKLNGFCCLNGTIGTYLSFTNNKILDHISFHAPFSVAVDGITIGMNMNEVEKIIGLPERKENWEDYPEQEEWIFYSKNTSYLFIDNKVFDITLYNFNGNYLAEEDIEKLVNAADGVYKIENRDDFVFSSSFDDDKPNEIK
jgi:hypothetical protein